MTDYSEEEFQSFIKQNRDLIEKMMSLQKKAAVETLSAGREITHEAVDSMVDTAEKAKDKTEEFVKTTYNMFTDPDVQKHFMSMGMEFMAGMSAMMQKAPMPDFVKDTAGGMEKNWKQSACKNNDECARKKSSKQRVNIEVDPQPVRTETSEPKTGVTEIVVTDYTKTE
ncbi:MAG: hypothetical protein ACI38Y_03775 [Candidatus Methanomethylophilaceae archaeon]